MIPLGRVSDGLRELARRAKVATVSSGRAAVFVGRTGEAVAVPYTDPGYAWALRRHAGYLVGVYEDDLGANAGLRAQILADLRVHKPAARKVA